MANYFLETQSHEWVLSSKTGGYALGTGNLINQRKYHGLLIKSDNNFKRVSLVSSIEEEIEWRGEKFYLDSCHYNNCIYPEGFLHLVKSWLRPFPVFLYSSTPHNDDILIKKEIMMDETTNTVLIKYTNLSTHKLHFKLKPKFTLRNHHHLNEPGTWDKNIYHSDVTANDELANIYFSIQRLNNNIKLFGWLQHGFSYKINEIYRKVFYPWEATRGYQSTEDVIAPFGLEFDLKINESNYLIFSDKSLEIPLLKIDEIEKRYKKLPVPKDIPSKRKISNSVNDQNQILPILDYNDEELFNDEEYLKIIEFSLTDFIANNDIIAGFPWFGAWGRDTMITLEGILKLPKGEEIAYDILNKYSEQIKGGLIPNMCAESHQDANYNSLDATLWFLLRLYEVNKLYKKGTKKDKILRWKKAISLTESILETIIEKPNNAFFIRMDGLLEFKESFSASTWMDAKINDIPVTPRNGAPVEINALLFNVLIAYEKMIDQHNEICPDREYLLTNQDYIEIKNSISKSFQKFWIEDYLADRLIGDEPIKEYRPNALIASSLLFSEYLLSIDKLQLIYETAHVELFTPYGIRSLSPRDFKFKKKYLGGQIERDKAYHQGTVWAWLLLPFVNTWLKAYPSKTKDETINHLSYIIEKFRIGYTKGHIASVAEVWDGDKPHFPKGSPAQAWSVSAIYCIEKIIESLKR